MSVVEVGTLQLVYAREWMERFGFRNYQDFCRMIRRERIPHVKLGGKLYLDNSRVEEEIRLRMERNTRRRRVA